MSNLNSLPDLSVVIPAYNGGQAMVGVVDELAIILPSITRNFEIIIVDDCSHDNSWALAKQLVQKHVSVHAIRFMRNVGQQNATLCGLRESQYDLVLTMDDDGQNPPSEIPKMLEKINKGFDLVYGVYDRRYHSIARKFLSQIFFFFLLKIIEDEMSFKLNKLTSFRILRRRTLEHITQNSSPDASVDVLLGWATNNVNQVTVEHRARPYGSSNYALRDLFRFATSVITNYSTIPLKFISVLAASGSILSFFIAATVIAIRLLSGQEVPGFAFLATIIAFFFSLHFLIMAVLGNYISRIYLMNMGKPQYLIDERCKHSDAKTIKISD
jgi:glycosyltransferase involved in cell wall biosynthesis